MKMTISINRYERDNLKAFANVKFDESFALESVKIKEAQTGKLYVELPHYKRKDASGNDEYKDVFHPISSEMRKAFNDAILSSYEQSTDTQRVFAFEYGKDDLTIGRVSVNPYSKDNLKGFANIVFTQGFALENTKIKYSESNNSLYIDLPKYKVIAKDDNGEAKTNEQGETLYAYKDIFHPISSESYHLLQKRILDAYNDVSAGATLQQINVKAQPSVSDSIGSLADFKDVIEDDRYGDVIDISPEVKLQR